MPTLKRALAGLLCAVTLGLTPAAYAESPEEPAAPDPGADAAAVVYLYGDGSYREYLRRGGQEELLAEGWLTANGEPDLTRPVAVTFDEPTLSPTPVYVSGAETYDEGTDTAIAITGYTPYAGGFDSYFLSAGDKIAVISPSALPSREQIAATAAGLSAWGFVPVQGRYVYAETRTLEQCVADLKWALEDPEIKAIFCVRGGYGATEVMDVLNETLIASAAKPIIGYSDITVYHAAWTRAGLPSIHACMSAAFAGFPADCAEAEQRMMKGELPAYRVAADANCREGTAEGVLIGGNLSTFTAALDTAYDSAALDRPYILFLEEVGENMQHIHRCLTILKHKGVLDRAAGIVFGEWTELPADGTGNYGEARGGLFQSVADMIARQFLDGVDVPVAFGFPAGHGDVNYPLLMGAEAKLSVSADSYTLSW